MLSRSVCPNYICPIRKTSDLEQPVSGSAYLEGNRPINIHGLFNDVGSATYLVTQRRMVEWLGMMTCNQLGLKDRNVTKS